MADAILGKWVMVEEESSLCPVSQTIGQDSDTMYTASSPFTLDIDLKKFILPVAAIITGSVAMTIFLKRKDFSKHTGVVRSTPIISESRVGRHDRYEQHDHYEHHAVQHEQPVVSIAKPVMVTKDTKHDAKQNTKQSVTHGLRKRKCNVCGSSVIKSTPAYNAERRYLRRI